MDAGMEDMPTEELIAALKELQPKITVILVCSPRYAPSKSADYNVESFDPRRLLTLLEKLQPEAIAAIEKRNEDLEEAHFHNK